MHVRHAHMRDLNRDLVSKCVLMWPRGFLSEPVSFSCRPAGDYQPQPTLFESKRRQSTPSSHQPDMNQSHLNLNQHQGVAWNHTDGWMFSPATQRKHTRTRAQCVRICTHHVGPHMQVRSACVHCCFGASFCVFSAGASMFRHASPHLSVCQSALVYTCALA